MNLICCQLDLVWEDKAANFARLRAMLAKQPVSPGSLLVLPEMFATGFSMNSQALAEEEENSPTINFLREISLQYQSAILAGMVGKREGVLTNDAVLLNSDGELLGHYSKVQPFTPLGEDRAVAAGSKVVTCSLGDWTLAPFICYDLRFPELFRLASTRAQLLVVIANWPAARIEQKLALLRARAIENQAYVVGVNRVGKDPNVVYNGQSVVIDPQGQIIAQASDQEELLATEIDFAKVEKWRADFPALRDRRDPATLELFPPS